MPNIKMKANDTLHISAVSPNSIQAGEDFEIDEGYAADLETRGLAKRVGGAKKESAPQNKMEAPPANKSENPEAAPEADKPREILSAGGDKDSGFVAADTPARRGRKAK